MLDATRKDCQQLYNDVCEELNDGSETVHKDSATFKALYEYAILLEEGKAMQAYCEDVVISRKAVADVKVVRELGLLKAYVKEVV